MSNELERERALREYLEGGSRLSREYGAMAGEEPGPEIDSAVLQQAHAAVAPGVSQWKRIAQPLALAATVVMTVSVVITMQGPETSSLPGTSAPALDVADPFADPVAAGQRAAPAREAVRKAERQPVLPRPGSSGQALPSEEQPLAKSVDLALQGARPTAAFNRDGALVEQSSRRDETVGAVRQDAAPAPSTALLEPAEEADAAYGFAPPPAAATAAVVAEKIQQDAAAAVADEAQEFAAQARLVREQRRSRAALTAAAPPPSTESAAVAASPPDRDRAFMQTVEPARVDDGAAEKEREPESWLEEIRDLVADGKVDQARTELNDFLEVYPDYPLDDTLSPLKPR